MGSAIQPPTAPSPLSSASSVASEYLELLLDALQGCVCVLMCSGTATAVWRIRSGAGPHPLAPGGVDVARSQPVSTTGGSRAVWESWIAGTAWSWSWVWVCSSTSTTAAAGVSVSGVAAAGTTGVYCVCHGTREQLELLVGQLVCSTASAPFSGSVYEFRSGRVAVKR